MHDRLGMSIELKHFFLPRRNHWPKRIALIFSFIIFDYLSTLAFCRAPSEEANLYARVFMENLGISWGLTLFVIAANLPIYMLMSLDSHVIRMPLKIASFVEIAIDGVFAWFIAGLHFSGGASWFWTSQDHMRQISGAVLYLALACFLVQPHKPRYSISPPDSA
jgi:hypothetical protein